MGTAGHPGGPRRPGSLVTPLGAYEANLVTAWITLRAALPRLRRAPAGRCYERLRASVPRGRLATPEDIAAAYVALLALPLVTGQVIVVDGGQTIPRPAG